VTIDYATERSNAIPGEKFTPDQRHPDLRRRVARPQLFFAVETFDDSRFDG
jgi:hypothetical protein